MQGGKRSHVLLAGLQDFALGERTRSAMGEVIDVHPRADEAANQLARGEDAGG
jgi:hypothetical protein